MPNTANGKAYRALEMIARLPRGIKKVTMVASDIVLIPVVLYLALTLKFGTWDHYRLTGILPYIATLLISLPLFVRLGLYRAVVRYMGGKAIRMIAFAVTVSTLLMFALDWFSRPPVVPYASLVIYWSMALIYVAGSRFLVRHVIVSYSTKSRVLERVAIYGAGDAGARLSMLLNARAGFEPIAFVDDKRALQGNHINGITVYSPELLPKLIRDFGIQRILIAMPTASRRRRQEILSILEPLGIRVQSLPELSSLMSGQARIDELRDVEVADLLGRDPVAPKPSLFRSCIKGKSVLVTGAGGSIGSELCRQILMLAPRRLVLFEMSELALYTIDGELKKVAMHEGLEVEIVPLLGNAQHPQRLREVMQSCAVQTVYHAAAYKHVPIVEHNVIEGLRNNVISTWNTAEAALEAGVETFVLVSTDKAVNPANIMGATKRFAELVLQGIQSRSKSTRFCMVRFGNVLDSSGSVVPLFREQIRRGGPVTVTHPDVIRYFMTIPEAAQLVIQAGAMGKGGDVFVLDMGQPVRIDDLARRMIGLMGLSVRDAKSPDGDIEIHYTGLRIAEKLYEELLIGSNVEGTDHPRILRAMEHSLSWERVEELLNELLGALSNSDCQRALARLMDAVAEYKPKGEILDYVWVKKTNSPLRPDAKIAIMHGRDFLERGSVVNLRDKPAG